MDSTAKKRSRSRHCCNVVLSRFEQILPLFYTRGPCGMTLFRLFGDGGAEAVLAAHLVAQPDWIGDSIQHPTTRPIIQPISVAQISPCPSDDKHWPRAAKTRHLQYQCLCLQSECDHRLPQVRPYNCHSVQCECLWFHLRVRNCNSRKVDQVQTLASLCIGRRQLQTRDLVRVPREAMQGTMVNHRVRGKSCSRTTLPQR